MEKEFEILRNTRKNVLKLVEGYSNEELNKIPEGFKNNMAWNLGHIVVTQQILCYKLSGMEMNISLDFVERFKKGTGVTEAVNDSTIQELKNLMISLPQKLQDDYSAEKFSDSFTPYETSYGVELTSVKDAISFGNTHEGLHYGYMMAMRKSL